MQMAIEREGGLCWQCLRDTETSDKEMKEKMNLGPLQQSCLATCKYVNIGANLSSVVQKKSMQQYAKLIK